MNNNLISAAFVHCFVRDCGKKVIIAEKQWLQKGIKVGHKHKKPKMRIINFPLRATKIIKRK
jgi:hypothetical protein